jgi:hypothetical protein
MVVDVDVLQIANRTDVNKQAVMEAARWYCEHELH